jgi:hypothetical protein
MNRLAQASKGKPSAMRSRPASAPISEKRRLYRARRLRRAQCVFNDGASVFDVLVRNLSPAGARIASGALQGLPETFELRIADSSGGYSARKVKIVWSNSLTAGLEFID